MKKLSDEAQRVLEGMKKGLTVTFRWVDDEAWYDDSHIPVLPSSLLELKNAGLIQVKKFDKAVLWVTYEIIPLEVD